MERPIAFKVLPVGDKKFFRIKAEPLDPASIKTRMLAPAVILASNATMLADLEAGIVDAKDIVALIEGDWSNAILIITDDYPANDAMMTLTVQERPTGDEAFLTSVQDSAPTLVDVAKATLDAIRTAGVTGQLVEKTKGRWVNSPLNSFTLKVQPRIKNLQFTLYGNPSSYEHNGFLLQDQNSYSRGWINNIADAETFAKFVSKSHARRTK